MSFQTLNEFYKEQKEGIRKNKQVSKMRPDFLMCPYVLYEDKNLKSLDRSIYGVIYWFDAMKDGICFASNKTIAEIAKTTAGSVANSISRLKKGGYIKVEMDKDNHRVSIKVLVRMGKMKR